MDKRIEILKCIEKGITTIYGIGKATRISQKAVREALEKFKEKGFIRVRTPGFRGKIEHELTEKGREALRIVEGVKILDPIPFDALYKIFPRIDDIIEVGLIRSKKLRGEVVTFRDVVEQVIPEKIGCLDIHIEAFKHPDNKPKLMLKISSDKDIKVYNAAGDGINMGSAVYIPLNNKNEFYERTPLGVFVTDLDENFVAFVENAVRNAMHVLQEHGYL
jgi:DNA-binding PadR family transcriptional regulator